MVEKHQRTNKNLPATYGSSSTIRGLNNHNYTCQYIIELNQRLLKNKEIAVTSDSLKEARIKYNSDEHRFSYSLFLTDFSGQMRLQIISRCT